MTALPYDFKRRYTVEEFAELPMDRSARYELQEGTLILSPRPSRPHVIVIGELYAQLRQQLSATDLVAIPDVDVHLEPLPATVRVPDLVIVRAEVLEQDEHLTPSSGTVVAVEVLSPGSVRTDTVIKPMEYADAGIPYFWLIDPQPPVTATVYRLVDGEYEESQRAEKVLEVDEPCPLRIELDELLPAKLR